MTEAAGAMRDTAIRAWLLDLYRAAVAAAHPETCLAAHLPPLPTGGILVAGAGKAAAAMAQAAEAHYEGLGALQRLSGFVTTRHGSALPTRRLDVVEAAHPVPDPMSRIAALRALDVASKAGPDDIVLVLLSGGASALWSAPAAGVSPEEKQELTRQLLRSGAPIGAMNTVRRHLSQIKGGRLAAAAHPARLLTLAISDVPGDDPETIGSGPTVPDPTTLADARRLLDAYAITPSHAVAAALRDVANETPKPGDVVFANADYRLVATPKLAIDAAADRLRVRGYEVAMLGDALEGEAREVARDHAQRALQARSRGQRLAILSGGELTVTVRGDGSGGPNQEYALALAMALEGADSIWALAADTDGIDGGSGNADDPAGATIDPSTLARAAHAAINPATFLDNNDATGFFRQVGGLVACGATQTNVNDFRVVLVDPDT